MIDFISSVIAAHGGLQDRRPIARDARWINGDTVRVDGGSKL
jgi:hypothetical protein